MDLMLVVDGCCGLVVQVPIATDILNRLMVVNSLALGIYEAFGVEHRPSKAPLGWIEVVAIYIAILIVALVFSLNVWQKERAFIKLKAKKEDREVKVFRSGKPYMISVHDDVCDESSAIGEPDALKKTSGYEAMKQLKAGATSENLDTFIIASAKVLEGIDTFIETSVGVNSSFGKINTAPAAV
ncbi:uncharacterized protein B0I36DRAFT_370013 [Microdochium trichocladiopsis]|uniref:Uncharacterized protein n=1 Tax=Microdochium trichocladiopsis TaxID=1682393 RepID=A0A9P8XSB1_9PEZI|nr:uncharacterized protein B0I36DRAFT_370013 [Microdochium trichocladiopsis]KAH7012247.1 hypothetical protein B0I36DRAFT_370013 [Microdochium trichocladiopsis]